MKSEFTNIIKEALSDESFSQANLASEACREALARKIEAKIKAKFHIFRINRVITGD